MEIKEITRARGVASGRTNKLKEQMLASPFDIDLARIRAYTKVWREMGPEGDRIPCMRAALALQETLRTVEVFIGDEERIVGTRGGTLLTDSFAIERYPFNKVCNVAGFHVFLPVTKGIHRRQLMQAIRKAKPEMERDILPFWPGKTVEEIKLERWKKEGLVKRNLLMGPVGAYRLYKGYGGIGGLLGHFSLAEGSIFDFSDMRLANGSEKASPTSGGSSGRVSSVSKIARRLPKPRELSLMLANAMQLGMQSLPDYLWLSGKQQGHMIPGFSRVLELGFEGIADRARRGLEELKEGDADYGRRRDFLESVMVSAKAVGEFSLRYAELAERQAAEATSEDRKAELLEVAERCRKVPMKPPETFMEALQSVFMTQVLIIISYGLDNAFSCGRLDQYIYPYYRKDIASGRITREQAQEALEEYLVKVSQNLLFGPNNITIGGLGKEGNDATNEVSYLFLEALENVRGMGDGLSVRISNKTPREFLLHAVKVNQITAGVGFFNDDIVIPTLLEEGFALEDARSYSATGCTEIAGTGDSYCPVAVNGFWLVGVLEMALNRGRRLITGTRTVGVRTPDPRQFRSFEDVKDAFEKQLAYVVEKTVRMAEVKDRVYADFFPDPILSATIEGCLESGQDATRGGARYNHNSVNAQGLATVADSLAAIRWAVFDEKIVSMEELLKAMSVNFKGYESLRQTLLKKAPKYGNDDPRADELAAWVSEVFTREVRKYRSFRGDLYRCSMISSATQLVEGLFCGATPDGRLALETVSNGASPVNGTELNGATAVLRSGAVGCKDALYGIGTAFNMNLDPSTIKSEEDIDKLASLIEAYFVLGGRHVQFNPLDKATLKDAQAHPEKYPDLTVKVSGYSARFVELPREIQDDIMARTEFDRL
jgi:formate C-acetyltransferase